MFVSTARSVADQALALRRSHAQAPTLDVLDVVMARHRDEPALDFGDMAEPAHPFAMLVAEAFPSFMPAHLWPSVLGPDTDQAYRPDALHL